MGVVSSLPTMLDVQNFGRAQGMTKLQQHINDNKIDMQNITSMFAKSSSNRAALTRFMLRNDCVDVRALEVEYSAPFVNAAELLVQKTYSLPKDPKNTLALLMMDVVPTQSSSVTISATCLSQGEERSLVLRTKSNDIILGGFPANCNLQKLVQANTWKQRDFLTYVLSLESTSDGFQSYHLHNLKIPNDLNDVAVAPVVSLDNRFASLQEIEPQGIVHSLLIILDIDMLEMEQGPLVVPDEPQGAYYPDTVMSEVSSLFNDEDEPQGIVHSLLIF